MTSHFERDQTLCYLSLSIFSITFYFSFFPRTERRKGRFIRTNVQNGLSSFASLFRSATWTTREHDAAPISFVAVLP